MQKSKIKIVSNRLKSNQKKYEKMKMKFSRGKRWNEIVPNSQNENQIMLLFIFIFGRL